VKIKNAELKGIYVNYTQLPAENIPEIALVGRSNVGKSSLINKLTNRKKLARSSSTPGKTRTINCYTINKAWHLVDLPGYGFAKVSQAERARWGKMIENYLRNRKQLRGVIQLVDIRHPPSKLDIMMLNWLREYNLPTLVVATKADKIPRGKKKKHITDISKTLNIEDNPPLCFSAESGEGVEELLLCIDAIIND